VHYPPGKAPLAILILAVISSALLLLFPPAKKPENKLQVWTFAKAHYDAYSKAIPEFERTNPGTQVDVQYVHLRAVTTRMRSAFASDLPVPDLLETEISKAGSFFLGPVQDIGFVDLSEELHKPQPDGPPWIDRIVRSRFAPYTSRRVIDGVEKDFIFGLPHDVHPVLLAYRRDIFEAHGVDAEKLTTWDAFLTEGRKIMKAMNGDGPKNHFLIELNDSSFEHFEVLLFQNGGGLFHADGTLRIDDEEAVQTMLWFVPLVAGPDRVAYSLGWNFELMNRSQENKLLLSVLMPDWFSGYYQKYVPAASGKMALMPLPAFKPGGRRTSTRGGTMLGFPKRAPHFKKAWELGLKLYFDTESRIEQFKEFNILPPTREAWRHPALSEPSPYWSGQPIGKLYAEQADNTPPQYTSPYIILAKSKIGEALSDCVKYYNAKGATGFEQYVRERLKRSGDEVRAMKTLNPYQ